MSFYLWKEVEESGWSKLLERMKRHGLQPEIEASCQVSWESVTVQLQTCRNRLLSTIGLSWMTSTSRIRHRRSVSVLHASHTPAPTPGPWGLLLEFALGILCPDLTSKTSLALQLCLWVGPKSYASCESSVWMSCVPTRLQYSATSKTWVLKTAPDSSRLQRLLLHSEYSSELEAWGKACLASQGLHPG